MHGLIEDLAHPVPMAALKLIIAATLNHSG